MKIFLDENYILLAGSRPANTDNEAVHGCSSVKETERLFRMFENKEFHSGLILYAASADFDITSSFMSLFKMVEAAGGIVKNELGEILFIYRWDKWDLPKGKLHGKRGESREVGALREVSEETGLKEISIVRELFPTFHIYHEKGKRILKKTWWFEMSGLKSEQMNPQTEEGITLVRWVGPKAMGPVLTNTYASLLELISFVTHNK